MKRVNSSTIKAIYKELKPEGFWFGKGEMRYFNTFVYQGYQAKNNTVYFVTGERMEKTPAYPERFSVRKIGLDGNIETVSKFQEHAFLIRALADCKYHANKEEGTEVQL